MASYYRRILRQAQAGWPPASPGFASVDWDAVVYALIATGTATSSGVIFTLTDGLVTVLAFDPASYGGGSLKGWFKSDSLALANNDPVSTWADSSALANNATQAGGIRPVYKTGILAGKPGVLFTRASSQYMLANGIAAAQSGSDLPCTVIIVIQPVALSTGITVVFAAWGDSVATNPSFRVYSNSAQYNMFRRDDAAAVLTVSTGAIETVSPQVLSYRLTGIQGQIFKDGTSVQPLTNLNVGALTVNRFILGASMTAGTPLNFYDGYVFEVFVYAADLSTVDRQAVERAMGAKWGITVA